MDMQFIAKHFGGDPEDCDDTLHPVGCRYAPGMWNWVCMCWPLDMPLIHGMYATGRQSITSDCSETYSTIILGGLHVIEEAICCMEGMADQSHPSHMVDVHGYDLAPNSLVLMCEVCMKHSVVSYESYCRVAMRDNGMQWCGMLGVHQPIRTAAEYYVHMACTGALYRTPEFRYSSKKTGEVKRKSNTRIVMDSIDMEEVERSLRRKVPKKLAAEVKEEKVSCEDMLREMMEESHRARGHSMVPCAFEDHDT